MNVSVSHHALWRWRERVAEYADATSDEIVTAMQLATAIPDGEPLPFARLPDVRYWRMAGKPDVYFVTEPKGIGCERVITVIDVSLRWLPPTKEQQTDKHMGKSPKEVVWERVAEPNSHGFEPAFADMGERREWLATEVADAMLMLSRLPKKHPQRLSWFRRHDVVRAQLVAINEKWKAWKAAKTAEQEASSPVMREDGTINYGPALRFLLTEVEQLKTEVQQLKSKEAA